MTDNKAMAVLGSRDMLATKSTKELEEVASKLMRLAVGARRLTPTQAAELAIASYILGANPFAAEIYHTGDYTGIMLGVEYYKRLGLEQLRLEDDGKIGEIFASYEKATHDDAQFDDLNGDVAWTVTLTDSVSHSKWLVKQVDLFKTLTDKGMEADKAWTIAERSVGPKPDWKASAVVYASEDFEGEYSAKDQIEGKGKQGEKKPQKWDRNERCKKRCFKWALKKRFSRLEIPEDDSTMIIDVQAREIAANIANQLAAKAQEQKVKTPEKLLEELGFGSNPTPPPPPEFTAPVIELSAKMDLQTAQNVLNHEGKRYGDLPTEQLNYMANTLSQALQAGKYKTTEKLNEAQFKLDACLTILQAAAENSPIFQS